MNNSLVVHVKFSIHVCKDHVEVISIFVKPYAGTKAFNNYVTFFIYSSW